MLRSRAECGSERLLDIARDGTRKLSEISYQKFSGNFRTEISIPFRNHSVFIIMLELCLIRPALASNAESGMIACKHNFILFQIDIKH